MCRTPVPSQRQRSSVLGLIFQRRWEDEIGGEFPSFLLRRQRQESFEDVVVGHRSLLQSVDPDCMDEEVEGLRDNCGRGQNSQAQGGPRIHPSSLRRED